MNIQRTENINFGTRVKTMHVLEITTQKVFTNEGFSGVTDTLKQIYTLPKATGNKGFRYYIELAGQKIEKKYPKIAEISAQLKRTIKENPDISKSELYTKARSSISEIGEDVDIVL